MKTYLTIYTTIVFWCAVVSLLYGLILSQPLALFIGIGSWILFGIMLLIEMIKERWNKPKKKGSGNFICNICEKPIMTESFYVYKDHKICKPCGLGILLKGHEIK